jgi:DNA-binding Xre family transcriptional regulator
MLRCNLALLLAERGLKISKVAKDTGISRTTLTALTNSTSQGVQLETIDKLCMYLKTDVSSFFVFHPSTISFILSKENDKTFLFLTIKYNTQIFKVLFEVYVNPVYIDDPSFNKAGGYVISLFFAGSFTEPPTKFSKDDEWEVGNEWFERHYYPKLPIIFRTDLENKIKNIIIKEFNIPDNIEITLDFDFKNDIF